MSRWSCGSPSSTAGRTRCRHLWEAKNAERDAERAAQKADNTAAPTAAAAAPPLAAAAAFSAAAAAGAHAAAHPWRAAATARDAMRCATAAASAPARRVLASPEAFVQSISHRTPSLMGRPCFRRPAPLAAPRLPSAAAAATTAA